MLRKLIIALALLLLVPVSVQAKQQSHFVVLVINSTSLQEIQSASMPTLKQLIKEKKAAVGLMNSRGGRRSDKNLSGYLTLGTGAKANAPAVASMAFNENEKFIYRDKSYSAKNWYRKTTGFRLGKGQILNLSIASSSRLATKYDYSLVPGLLGKKLLAANIKRAVVGNADAIDGYHREVTLIGMDTTGKVDCGNVEVNTNEPLGYKKLLKETSYFLKKAQFVVVELGETARLDHQKDFLTDKKYVFLKNRALKKADLFLKSLLKEINLHKDVVVVVSPTTSRKSLNQKNRLAPLVIIKEKQASFLFSESTKWSGIVDNTDFAPTVLKFFSLDAPNEMLGRVLKSTGKSKDPINKLIKDEQVAVANTNARRPLLTSYVVLIIIALVVGILLLFLPNVKGKAYAFAEGLLIYILSVPIVLLLFSLVNYSSALTLIIATPLISLALTLLVVFFAGSYFRAIVVLVFSVAILIVVDVVTGSNLMRNSVLGFSPIAGARFYGLGNEYMGIVIGSVILSLALFKDIGSWGEKGFIALTLTVFLLVTFIIGFPGLGANVGGALAAFVGFTLTFYCFKSIRFSWKQPTFLLLGLLGVVAVIMLSDRVLGLKTHAGLVGNQIFKGEAGQVLLIFKRKILVNLKLVRYTAWTNVLITILIALPVLFIKPAGAIKRLKDKLPGVWAGVIGIGFGAIAAFIFNDSGVVAAATSLLYAAVIVLYVIIDEQKEALDGNK